MASPMPAASPSPANLPTLSSAALTAEDQIILEQVPGALARGHELLDWYDQKSAGEAQWFPVAKTYRPEDKFKGFFGTASICGEQVPVMGAVQNVFYDHDRFDHTAYYEQVRAFALNYFLRAAEFRIPQIGDSSARPTPFPLDLLSWRPLRRNVDGGFCFSQLYFKEKATGKVGKFLEEDQQRIVPLKQIGTTYEWIILRSRIFGADLPIAPFGPAGPQLVVPFPEETYLVVDEKFVFDSRTADGRATYGVGYSMLRYRPDNTFPFVYGPGMFNVGVQLNRFHVDADGVCELELPFMVNRPGKVMDVLGADPLRLYIAAVNFFTLGRAASLLDISMETVERYILYSHSQIVMETIVPTVRAFREVQNWTDGASIPEWLADKKS